MVRDGHHLVGFQEQHGIGPISHPLWWDMLLRTEALVTKETPAAVIASFWYYATRAFSLTMTSTIRIRERVGLPASSFVMSARLAER
jgi:hypothetical protein